MRGAPKLVNLIDIALQAVSAPLWEAEKQTFIQYIL
jgi:hypothetical protein